MGKKKGAKKNWKSVPVSSVIDANVKKSTNWADEVDQALQDDVNDHVPHKTVVLPTAPRASRASDFDETRIPHVGPFQIHVSNVPYELEEQELVEFFEGLAIKHVRLPKEEGKKKGYGYVEFEDRQSLIAALNKPETVIKNRNIKIDLSTNDRGRLRMDGRGGNRDGGMRGGDMGGPDRTAGNWRSGPRDDFEPPGMERGGGGGFRSGGGGRDFSSGSGGFRSGGFEREERGGGFGRDREERGGSSFREDRGFRDDRGGGGFERDRGDRGGYPREERRNDFDRGGYGFRDRDERGGGFSRDNRGGGGFRDRGFDEERREERGSGGGSWRDDSQGPGNFSKFEERRDRDREPRGDRGFGAPMTRREDAGPPMQERAPATERKKLNLQPRSSALPPPEKPVAPAVVSSAIFGGAKPVDTMAREREIEARLNRGEDVSESRSGPGSTASSKDLQEREERDKTVEPAPPPKENAWLKNPTSPVVNNGRTTPDGPSGDERGEGQKSWGRGEPKQQESRRTDDQRERSNKLPPKSGPPALVLIRVDQEMIGRTNHGKNSG
uniref:Eukaryotic translation initiation factor 4B n=1 Tax=Lygus hesperus TaxID=30085 RepID=A0A0A9Z5V6_LYGHE